MRKIVVVAVALATLTMVQNGYAITKQEAEERCIALAQEQGMSGEEMSGYIDECVLNLISYEEDKAEKE